MYNPKDYLLLLALAPAAYAACECGYKTNTQDFFQYALLTDFSTSNLAAFQNSPDWTISSVVYGQSSTRPFATNYTANNVNVTNGSLQLKCSAYDASSSSVPSAQIETARYDILHGSFRAQYRVQSNSSGAVSGFFFYANDTAEIDIELLTRDNARDVVFTNQPDESMDIYMPNQAVHSNLNDYRFDWKAGSTSFYVNNVLSNTKTKDVPSINGSIYLNMWGGSTYAGNPAPSTDDIMSVAGIQLYFNSSDPSLTASWTQTCARTKTPVCLVDAQVLQRNATTATSTSVTSTTLATRVASSSSSGPKHGLGYTHSLKWAPFAATALYHW